jgi:hypothetical protein
MYYGYNQEDEKGSFVQWIIRDAGVYQACGPTVPQLPPGAYSCTYDNYGNAIFQSRRLYVDDLIDFTDSIPSKVLHEIDRFWSLGDRFKKYGFLHRRGYLFFGKLGCGKSSIIHQVIGRIIAAGNLAFFCEQPNIFIRCMEQFRKVEPNRPMVCVFEDIDAIIATFGDSDLLQWLDGNHQVDRAVNLATTNYPERLDRRIISRPRRFDRLIKIEPPDARLREMYFTRKLPELSRTELVKWVEISKGLPFAALAELVISVACLGNSLEEAAQLLHSLNVHEPNSGDFLLNETPPEDEM